MMGEAQASLLFGTPQSVGGGLAPYPGSPQSEEGFELHPHVTQWSEERGPKTILMGISA